MAKVGGERQERRATRNDVDFKRAEQWGKTRIHLAWATAAVFGIWALQYPLHWISFCMKDLAGRETKISFGFTLTISLVGVSAVVAAIIGHVQKRKQSKQLIALRRRCTELEGRIAEHRVMATSKKERK